MFRKFRLYLQITEQPTEEAALEQRDVYRRASEGGANQSSKLENSDVAKKAVLANTERV